jgi:hypothetical protein
MGGLLSKDADARHIHLHTWANPSIQERRAQISIRLAIVGLDEDTSTNIRLEIVNGDELRQRLFHSITSSLKPDEQCILLRIHHVLSHSEFLKDITLEIRDLFEARLNVAEATHADDTGSVQVFCPKQCSVQPQNIDRLLYQPRSLTDSTITNYAGLENAILNPRSRDIVPDEGATPIEVFEETDPIIEFIAMNAETLNPSPETVKEMNTVNRVRYYKVEPEFLKEIRELFKDTVFDNFRYTRFENTRLCVNLPAEVKEDFFSRYKKMEPYKVPQIFVVLNVLYIVVTPGQASTRHREYRLN